MIDFNIVGELESLERKVKWKSRFKLFFSLVFLATLAVLVYLMPVSIGLSIMSLGGLVTPDKNALKLAAILGTALSGILLSVLIGLGKLGTIGLAATSVAPILYISNIKAFLLTYIAS